MKTNNLALQLVLFSYKLGNNIRLYLHLTGLLTGFFLFISFLSFAGEIVNNPASSCMYGNYSAFLKTGASPLTGSESLRTNLYLVNANNTTILADGVLTEYNNLYHDSVYLEDAYKFTNINENLGLNRYGSVLAIERRPIINLTDSLFLKLWKTTRRNYQFEFVTINLDHPGMQAFLEDAYLNTSTQLALSGTTKVNFSINTDLGSANVSRFRIVYRTNFFSGPLPVTFSSFKGNLFGGKISIDWKVENEINIEKYEVERSANGIDFVKVNSIAASGKNTSFNSYYWIDNKPLFGNNFFRIKSVERDGSMKVSTILKITNGKVGTQSISIYPNPVKDNIVNLRLTNQQPGIYQVRLYNNKGQLLYSKALVVSSSNISQPLFTNNRLAGGIYQLEVKSPGNIVQMQKIIVL